MYDELHKDGTFEVIYPNIKEVRDRIKTSKIHAKGKNWIAIFNGNKVNKELNDIFDYLEDNTKCGGPIFFHYMTIDDYR